MARDLNDAWGWIQKLISRVSRLESGAMLENSSITNGRMRFIGGLLRLDSGARLEVVGTTDITGSVGLNGPVNIAGTQTVTGILNVNGPWNLAGTGGITGDVSSTGNWTQTGTTTITLGGKIQAGNTSFDANGINAVVALLLNAPSVILSTDMIVNGDTTLGGDVLIGDAATLLGRVDMTGLTVKPGSAANLHIDAAGRLWKTS